MGNDPSSSSYTPNTFYQYDTAATAAKLGTGEWETLFPNENQGAQGDEQATAYGSTPAHCIVDGPIGNGTSEQGDVFCFDTSGNPLDTFTPCNGWSADGAPRARPAWIRG